VDELLAGAPDDVEGLYVLAVCQRVGREADAARTTLSRLRAIDPKFARGYQELGHLERDAGSRGAAMEAYARAVLLNPALAASWRELARLYRDAGEGDRAEQAEAQLARLSALPRELVSVTSFLHEGRLYKAERLCRAFLKQNPRHVEGMRLLAQLGAQLGVYDDAEFLLESALEFEPDYLPARIDYVSVLQKRQKFARARDEARRLLEQDPEHPLFRNMLAGACVAAGGYDEALEIYDTEVSRQPRNEGLQLARGHALKTVGRQQEAIASYRRAAGIRADFGDAYWSLANLKTYEFDERELNHMRAAEQSRTTEREDRIHLCFALGKALEDRGEYQESFAYYDRGNRLKRESSRYSADTMSEELEAQKTVCTRELLQHRPGRGNPAEDPIFIVGLPRAGSTLLEQILASHSQVDGTLELPNVLALVRRLDGRRRISDAPRYPGILKELTDDQLTSFGTRYLEDTEIHRQGAPRFTDKMPNNFRHIGLIHMMLPNATIIDARREPMACCFSAFKQLFAEGQEFSYGLEQIGRYYRDYVDLMRHWDEVLPGRILRVNHEDVVADLEGQVRRLLDFCALDFEPGCLEFHDTDRAVRTASSEQVRQPIYRQGTEQWRRFDAFLDPLRKALGPELAPPHPQ
jgi:tetratricopeptide (TPR) repeat protein